MRSAWPSPFFTCCTRAGCETACARNLGEASVREVQEAISERKRPAYTTVQTIFARLEEKKAVRRTRKIGNAFLFEPLITRTSVYRRLIDEFLVLFRGSAEPVLARLAETGKLTLEDLKAVRFSLTRRRLVRLAEKTALPAKPREVAALNRARARVGVRRSVDVVRSSVSEAPAVLRSVRPR